MLSLLNLFTDFTETLQGDTLNFEEGHGLRFTTITAIRVGGNARK